MVKITKHCLENMGLNIQNFLISQNIFVDLKGPNENYKLHYGRCTDCYSGPSHSTTQIKYASEFL